ncbi:hypothetical protein L289_0907 [Acinetobacter gerneri DSM 14967 = CIP 107464 = MTCC 9824]|nr:hypothetical protein [Acinetobacter gerneri]EPR80172.1 hypothetical protein L289_0907 [Acinetobacter gerneri DSM 14967 = CIP 107464 = MTCC 9824]
MGFESANHKTDSDRINYLIGLFKSNDGEEEKIKKFKKKLEEKTIHKKEKLLDFNDEFSNLFLYFEKFFLTNNLEYNLNNKELKIVDFNIAKIIAHDQDIDEPFESWNDLRSSVSKKVYSIVYEKKINIDIFEKKIDQLNQILEKKLESKNTVFYYFLDDMESDIHLILMAIYIGYSEKLINLLLEAYKSNFLPCGWEGEYPLGNLCITNGMLNLKK